MITRHILAITVAALFAAPILQAQTAAPATAPTPAAVPPPATGAPAAPTAKAKPLSSTDAKGLTSLMEAMQFHIRMGEVARHKDKEDKELVGFANKNHKAMTSEWTPMVNFATERGVENKNIPSAVSNADKADIAKLGKAKPEKWKEEYFELLAKNGKKNARSAENVVKSINDPQAKEAATKVAAVITSQATEAEAKFKELKEKK